MMVTIQVKPKLNSDYRLLDQKLIKYKNIASQSMLYFLFHFSSYCDIIQMNILYVCLSCTLYLMDAGMGNFTY